jgi:hypothetical protein
LVLMSVLLAVCAVVVSRLKDAPPRSAMAPAAPAAPDAPTAEPDAPASPAL